MRGFACLVMLSLSIQVVSTRTPVHNESKQFGKAWQGSRGPAVMGECVSGQTNDCTVTGVSGGEYGFLKITTGEVKVENVQFMSCSSTNTDGGGVAYVKDAVLTFTSCNFDGCRTSSGGGFGGAIGSFGATVLTVQNSIFMFCEGNGGGAIGVSNKAGKCTITGSLFDLCTGRSYGGTLYGTGVEMSLSGVTITNSWAKQTGGAIDIRYTSTSVLGSIYMTHVTAHNCSTNYVTSMATTYDYGGGFISVSSGANATLISCGITDCRSSQYGGAIATQRASNVAVVTVEDSEFHQTRAEKSGGVVFFAYSAGTLVMNRILCVGCTCEETSGQIINIYRGSVFTWSDICVQGTQNTLVVVSSGLTAPTTDELTKCSASESTHHPSNVFTMCVISESMRYCITHMSLFTYGTLYQTV